MFFNSLERKLKKSYGVLNPGIRDQIFPNGKNEYVYVGRFLDYLFKNRDVFELLQIYASVYTYYKLESANAVKTFVYATKKTKGILNDEETITLIALVALNIISLQKNIEDPMATLEEYKGYITSNIDTAININENIEKFATRNSDVGTVNNPILVEGVKGVRTYLESVDFKVDEIDFKKAETLFLTDNSIDMDFAVDEYVVFDVKTGKEITRLWFNIYGMENCKFAPDGFKFK